jgi:thioredoxin:protein disulfide reductase
VGHLDPRIWVTLVILGLLATFSAAQAALTLKPEQVVTIGEASLDKVLRAANTSTLAVTAQVASGWHINSDQPLNPDFIPTRLKITVPDGVKVGTVRYPLAETMALSFAGDEKLSVFSGMLEFDVPLTPAANFKPAPTLPASITIDYQPCNDTLCLRPASVSVDVDLARIAKSEAGSLVAVATHPPGESAVADVFSHQGYLLGFLFVLLAGIALNLTPCVYPLIAVTIAYFGNQGGSPSRVISLALTYVIGIALMFSSLGVAVALSGGLFGAAMQNPYVLAGIAAMLLVLAASSFGWFALQPPQWMLNRAGLARPGFIGALGMGLGMGIVAAPCIGPVVLGLLLLVERSQSPLFGFALFFTLAIGLGAPYVALALAAGSIRRLPRSGEWLRWVEQLFGFVLAGLALYFVDPIVPNHLIMRLLPFYAAIVGVFLGFITAAGRSWRPFWVLRLGLGALAVAGFMYLLIPGRYPARIDFRPYDSTLLETARAEHRPVLIDFSASWCIPCREMEVRTFTDPRVRVAASRFIAMRADVTVQDGKNDALMHRFGVQGVPTAVFIDSRGNVRKQVFGYIDPRDFAGDLREID